MKRVLIISPYFPPSNAADMQRIRMSLPYLEEYGWDAEVVTVATEHSDLVKDLLLLDSIPPKLTIHTVGALPKTLTSKIGLGSIALRSLLFYKSSVNRLLRSKKYDLIFFSTTQFPVCILGPYWQKKFNVPYVIDMQDPWHTDYYEGKPKHERPRKYWWSYRLNKFLEPIAMKGCNGLISVCNAYIDDLNKRYNSLNDKPSSVITFGAFTGDLEIVKKNRQKIAIAFKKEKNILNLVYIGVSGVYMQKSLTILFSCFKRGLQENERLFSRFRFKFIGTSYAPPGQGKMSVLPVAEEVGIKEYVFEQTDRIPFYNTLASLNAADGLIIPGTDDPGYTASKLYPYIMAEKQLLGIFHPESNALEILKRCAAGQTITLREEPDSAFKKVSTFLENISNKINVNVNWTEFEEFTARKMTEKQAVLFQEVLNCYNQKSQIKKVEKQFLVKQ